jgi:hypothetical protein
LVFISVVLGASAEERLKGRVEPCLNGSILPALVNQADRVNGWNPHGSDTGHAGDDGGDDGDFDGDYDDDNMAKKQRLLLFVKEAWKVRGYDGDLALETSHARPLEEQGNDKQGPRGQGGDDFPGDLAEWMPPDAPRLLRLFGLLILRWRSRGS